MLGFLLSNVHSLYFKCNKLHGIAVNYNSADIAASETWLNADIPDSTVTFPGYRVHWLDCEGSGGGGVALYVCNSISQIRLTY